MKNLILLPAAIIVITLFHSCTDLEVLPFDQFTRETFYQNREQVEQAVFRPYHRIGDNFALHRGNVHRLNGLVADEIIWPQKGRHGYDGGDWGRLHYHTWSHLVDEGQIRGAWNNMYTGIGYINFVLEDFESINFAEMGITQQERNEWEGQLRCLRAFSYLNLMCMFGGVPIVETVDLIPSSPARVRRVDVFEYVESEILTVLNNGWLAPLAANRHGKMTVAGALATLVDLYLNAYEWTGQERWDDVIKYSNYLLNIEDSPWGAPGAYTGNNNNNLMYPALDANIEVTYAQNNSTATREGLFGIAYNNSFISMGRADYGAYRERDIVSADYGGNNGIVVMPNAFFRFNDHDLRKHSWFLYGIDSCPEFGNYGAGVHGFGTALERWKAPYYNLGSGANRQNMGAWVTGQEEFANLPIIFAYRPITARYIVTGPPPPAPPAGWNSTEDGQHDIYSMRDIEFVHWFSPEFPDDFYRDRILDACRLSTWTQRGTVNKSTREILMDRWDAASAADRANGLVVNFSGSTNRTRGYQFNHDPASSDFETALADYRFMWQCCTENVGARTNKYKANGQSAVTHPFNNAGHAMLTSRPPLIGLIPCAAASASLGNHRNNHYFIYRLSYIYFAKAEALMRKAGGVTQEAVDLVNQVKQRAYLPTYWASADAVTNRDRYTVDNFDMDELLEERGREFIFEGFRRRDLIRFDKFEFGVPWWDANWNYPSFGSFVNEGPYADGSGGTRNTDKSRRLFPIPFEQMQNNPSMEQNPGYL